MAKGLVQRERPPYAPTDRYIDGCRSFFGIVFAAFVVGGPYVAYKQFKFAARLRLT